MDNVLTKSSLKSMFQNVEQRFRGVIGILIALIFGSFGVYQYFHVKNPGVVYRITSEAQVFDVHEPVRDLRVMFRDQDIQDRGLSLRILTIVVQNDGEDHLQQDLYAEEEPFGFRLSAGEIAEVRLTDAGSTYARRHARPRITGPQTVEFEKLILDRGDFFVVEAVILHPLQDLPTVIPMGKVVGVEEFRVERVAVAREDPPFWEQVLRGGPLVHGARLALYFAGVLLTGVAISFVMRSANRWVAARHRRQRLHEAVMACQGDVPHHLTAEGILVQYYVSAGRSSIEFVSRALNDEEMLRWVAQDCGARHTPEGASGIVDEPTALRKEIGLYPFLSLQAELRGMYEAGAFNIVDNTVVISDDFREFLAAFLKNTSPRSDAVRTQER